MFDLISRNRTPSRPALIDLTNLGSAIARWLPFAGRGAAVSASLQLLGTLPLTAQSSLALVRVHSETLVLGITPQSVTLLTKTSDRHSHIIPADENPAASGEQNVGAISTDASRRANQSGSAV